MKGGAGAGLTGSEAQGRRYFPSGPQCSCVLGLEVRIWGIYRGPQSLSGCVGPQPALPSTVRLTSPKPLV